VSLESILLVSFQQNCLTELKFQGHVGVTNKTIPLISLNNFPIPWDKSKFKYIITFTTLKEELMGKADVVFDVIMINKKRKN
jgi:hypothetical protein